VTGMPAALAVIVPSTPTKVFNALANIMLQKLKLLILIFLDYFANAQCCSSSCSSSRSSSARSTCTSACNSRSDVIFAAGHDLSNFFMQIDQLDLLRVEARGARAVGLLVHERVRLRGLHLLLEELRHHLRLEYAPSVELEAHTALHALS
jgi:hypothetical protein